MNVEQFEISRYGDEAIKQILWQLCYDPFPTAFKLGFGECNEEELKKLIITKCHDEGRLLDFACEKPNIETFGIDLGIKNPIVRDIIIQKCHLVVLENGGEIEKILRLLKTEDNGTADTSRRIHGGLREMNFSRSEALYIQETCNIHPIYLLIKRINQDLNDSIEESLNSKICFPETDEKVKQKNNDISVIELILNEEKIKEVLSIISNEDVERVVNIAEEISALEEKLKILRKLEITLKSLEEKGITFNYISDKKDYLIEFYKNVEKL